MNDVNPDSIHEAHAPVTRTTHSLEETTASPVSLGLYGLKTQRTAIRQPARPDPP